MIIERLELTDFLSHRSSVITFSKGLTAIIGPNGAGKSSMIEGIIFSLFQDSFRTIRGGTKESLKRIGAKSASVKLVFNIAGRKFRVERFIEKGSMDRLYEDDKLVASQTSYVDKKILEVLGIPRKEAYLNTIVVRQGELEKVLESFTTASGREELMRALGFKELDDVAEALKEERSEFEKEYMRLLGEAAQLENLKRQLECYQKELQRYENERNKILENLNALEKGLSYIEKALSEVPEGIEQELSSITEEYYKVRSELESLNKEIRRLQEELESLKTLKKDIIALHSALKLKEVIYRLQDKLERAALSYSKLEEVKSTLRKLEEKLTYKLKILSQTLQCPPEPNSIIEAYIRLKTDIETKERLIGSLKANIEEKRTMLSSLEKSGDECPLCGAKMTYETRLKVLERIKIELSKATSELDELTKSLEHRKKTLSILDRLNVAGVVDEATALNEEKRRHDEEERAYLECIRDVNKLLEGILSSEISGEVVLKLKELLGLIETPVEAIKLMRQISDFTSRAEGKLEELERISAEENQMTSELERLLNCKEELNARVTTLERRIEELKKKLEVRRKLIEESNRIKTQIAEQRGRLLGVEESINSYRKRLEELKELCSKAESAEREASKIKSFIDFIDFLRVKVFGKDGLIAKNLRRVYRTKLESEVNNYLSRFGMEFETEFDEDLKLKVISRGEELSVDSLSGGEKAVLALSTRLALAKALSSREVEFLILDEPTANLDADRRRELVRVLRDLAEEMPQVIVVTHDPEVAEAADQVYRVRKDGGISIVEEY